MAMLTNILGINFMTQISGEYKEILENICGGSQFWGCQNGKECVRYEKATATFGVRDINKRKETFVYFF